MKVIGGISSQALACRVANSLRCPIPACEFKSFPDGELYVRVVGDIKGEDVVIVQSIVKDRDLICLLQLIEAVEEEAEHISVVIPYLGYARQDKRFKSGEAISARAIARSISIKGVVDDIYVVNLHSRSILRYFEVPAKEIDVSPLIGDYIASKGVEPVIIGPDKGAMELSRSIASSHNFEYDVLEKRRISGEEVEIKPKELSVEGRNVVIVDDIISTGGTISEAASILKAQGAKDIYVACIHGVFAQNSIIRLYSSGIEEIVATDTIESAFSKISIAGEIAKNLLSKGRGL
ncbi:MAG: ribose-phosphate diphosphokinase [Candidatus Methanospirareceae archaeon]